MDSSNGLTTKKPIKSAKRLAREAKLAKQEATKRTREERQAEVDKIMEKFQELGIPEVMLGDFPTITKEFIELGISASGVIPIPDIQRELIYLLSNNRRHQCASMLKAL
jgi:translation initiation factor IF-2